MLVANRECGTCTVCCHALSITAPTLNKPSGILCHHSDGTGCGIYADRPGVCRAWYCAWRQSDTLDDSWRPDRCGFLVEITDDGVGDGLLTPGLKFTLLRSTDDLRWPPFVDIVTRAVGNRQPVFLSLVGPPGYYAATTMLNIPLFIDAVAANDTGAILRGLIRAGACLEAHHWEKIPA